MGTDRTSVLLACLLLVVPRPGWADSFTLTDIEIRDPDNPDAQLTEEGPDAEVNEFFNLARCVCETQVPVTFRVTTQAGVESQTFRIVAGQSCIDNEGLISDQCVTLPYDVSETQNVTGDFDATLSARSLMADAACDGSGSNTIKLAIYVEATGSEADWSQLGDQQVEYTADVDPPTAPEPQGTPQGGEGRATVSFSSNDRGEDITYQLLCVKRAADGSGPVEPWKAESSFSPAFMTPEALCGRPTPNASAAQDGAEDGADGGASGGPDAGVDASGAGGPDSAAETAAGDASSEGGGGSGSTRPADLLTNRAYLCSERLRGDGEAAVSGLTGESEYGFYVVAIDKVGNPSAPVFLGWTSTQPAEDLWERYRRLGGEGEGGYGCAASHAAASAPWAILGVGLFVALLAARRSGRTRRKRGRCR